MATETVNAAAPRRMPWMLILFAPRVAFYLFMALRDYQFWQYAQTAHGISAADRHNLPLLMSVAMIVLVAVVEGLIWGIYGLVALGRRSNERQRAQQAEYAARLASEADEIAKAPLQPISVAGLVLQPGEEAYFRETVQLFGQHSVTHRQGHYGGVSVRVPGTHGALRLNTGTFASSPVSKTAMASEGAADLILTNDRILLLSLGGNSTHALRDIIGVTPFTDGVRIDFSHGKPLIATSGSQRLGLLVQRILHEPQRSPK